MRFVEKIEHARLVGIRLDVHQWWDPGDPNDPETGPVACLVGMAAWTDQVTQMIPGRMFAVYPWLLEFVEFQGREVGAYAAIEYVSHLINDRVITWREAYTLIDQWEPRPVHGKAIHPAAAAVELSPSSGARIRRRPRSRIEVS